MSVIGGLRAVLVALSVAAMLGVAPAAVAQDAETLTGPAKAIDADIIVFTDGNRRVIIWGIDAPELNQTCPVGDVLWPCYAEARTAMEQLVGSGPVSCVLKPDKPDPFGRRLGVCKVGDIDIGAEMVKRGLALAYVDQSDDYVAQQAEAEKAQIGFFQPGAKIMKPWDWRKSHSHTTYR